MHRVVAATTVTATIVATIGLLATAGLTATAALTTASLLPRNDHDVTERCHAVACTLCVRARMQYVCVTGVYVHCLHSPM
jgi:hypothetical protein